MRVYCAQYFLVCPIPQFFIASKMYHFLCWKMRVSILETQSYKSKISVQQSLLEITQQMIDYENINPKNISSQM